ncbi:MAG TPA: Fic family protein [Longimicrobiaceae bacterium]|nr:Fic family protein [Longimicrobiaceae bacterium]
MRRTGGETVRAFIPNPLPPVPELRPDTETTDLLERANRALGRVDGLATLLPDYALFLYFYIRKEAVLSSQIEGTQSSISELLLYENEEAPGVPLEDVKEVSRYVAALEFGVQRVRDGFPLSLRLIRAVHRVLLAGGRGSEKEPGEFRRSQNWVGGTRPGNALYAPPPGDEVVACMGALERFLHDEPARTPTLLKVALSHVQFETIHPFLDGNGRVGRLLITLILCAEGALSEPLLYLSVYLKQHRSTYYDLLQAVRMEGDWEAWLRFFLTGVQEAAEQAASTAQRILGLFERDRKKVGTVGRAGSSLLRVLDYFHTSPLASASRIAGTLHLSAPTVGQALRRLTELGVLQEVSGRRWGRLFVYREYLDILSEGTDPLRSPSLARLP